MLNNTLCFRWIHNIKMWVWTLNEKKQRAKKKRLPKEFTINLLGVLPAKCRLYEMIAIKRKALINWPNAESRKEMKNLPFQMVVPNLASARREKVRGRANAFRKFICEAKRIRWMANINYKSIHFMMVLWSKHSFIRLFQKPRAEQIKSQIFSI